MIFKEIEIDQDEPFKNDRFNRKEQVLLLSRIIPRFSQGGVIALNNKWGSGKTTFIKMLQTSLINEYNVIYFNAWENDYEEDPFYALFYEIKNILGNSSENYRKVAAAGGKIALDLTKFAVEKAFEKFVGRGSIKELYDIISKQSVEFFHGELKKYEDRKEGIEDFKKVLSSYLASENEKEIPIIFIIDELDRCRPDFAVKLLERVKHLFIVPNVLFLLAIDKEQLCHSIRGFYGSENIDSNEYLRRFIDLEYSLPKASNVNFVTESLNDAELVRNITDNYKQNATYFLKLINFFLASRTPRQIQKFIIHLNLILKSKILSDSSFRVFLTMLYIKYHYSDVYFDLVNDNISDDKLSEVLFNIYNSGIEKSTFVICEADLIFSYLHGYTTYSNRILNGFYTKNEDSSELNLVYKSRIDQIRFEEYFKYMGRDYGQPDSLPTIIDLIELTH